MSVRHILAVVQSDLQLICSLRHILEFNGFPSLTIARNSQETILYLRGIGVYGDRGKYPIPSVIILDCQNPEGEDLEVLAWLRERADLHPLPVILLCSERHSTGQIACALDPQSFIVDRGDFNDLLEALHNVDRSAPIPPAAVANSFRRRI